MKRKLLSLALALTLVFSLSAPAMAAEVQTLPPSPPPSIYLGGMEADIDAWTAAHPEEVAAFDHHAYFEENYPYYDSEQEYMDLWELESEEAFRSTMLTDWVKDQVLAEQAEASWARALEEHPEETAQFLAGLDGWFAQEYSWYDNGVEEYLEGYATREAGLSELYQRWSADVAKREAEQKKRSDFITAHGGAPGQLNVMVNGAYLAFPEGKRPYAEQGVTLVDAESINAALGTKLTGVVPLRVAAQEAGYTVVWDADYNSVVLTGEHALADLLDQKFTAVNALLAGPRDGKTHTSSTKFNGELVVLNSLDGDQTIRFSGKAESALRDGSGSLSLSLDLKELAKLPGLAGMWEAIAGERGFLDAGEADALLSALKNFKLEMMLDREAGVCYLRSPLLTALDAGAAPEGAWVSLEMGELDYTMGDLVAETAVSQAGWPLSPVQQWDRAVSDAQLYVDLLGDSRFTPKGDGWDYKLDVDTMAEIGEAYAQRLLEQEDSSYYYNNYAGMDWSSLFRACDIKLHMEPDGTASGSFLFRPDYGGAMNQIMPGMGELFTLIMPMIDFQMEGELGTSGNKQSYALSYRFKNTMDLSLNGSTQKGTSDKAPQTAPEEGETVVEG